MDTSNLSKKISSEKSLKEYLEGDIWYLSQIPLFRQLTEKNNKKRNYGFSLIDFTLIDNPVFRKEIRDYVIEELSSGHKSLLSFSHDWYRFKIIIRFLNTLSIGGSLLQYSYQELIQGFRRYLTVHNYSTVGQIQVVVENQTKKTYHVPADKIYEIRRIYQYVQEKHKKAVPEWEKDIWDVEALPFHIEKSKSRNRRILNFTNIFPLSFRTAAKQYILARLKLRKYSTVCDDMKALKEFSLFLQRDYKDLTSLEQVDRSVIESYILYLKGKCLAPITFKQRIGFLRTFFEMGAYMEIAHMPRENLIFRNDYRKNIRLLPEVIPEIVLDQLHQYLYQLPRPVQICTTLLENIGMRPNEICQLKWDCLKMDSNGYAYLEYFQSKTQCFNRIPLSDQLTDIIKEQQQRTLEQFAAPQYLFQIKEDKPIGQETIARWLNLLSYNNQITDQAGKIYRFKLHHFRHTVATRYAREGMSPGMLREMLGHKSIRAMMHYIEFHKTLNSQKVLEFEKHENQFLKDALGQNRIQDTTKEIPLPFGFCNSAELCETAMICYSCGMFHADAFDSKNLERYCNCLSDSEKQAGLEGHKREQENYHAIRMALEKLLRRRVNG